MQKIVINTCYGGFSLSPLAEKSIAERKGINVFFYKQTKYSYKDGMNEFEQIGVLEASSETIVYTLKKDLGKRISDITNDDADWFNSREIERHDPDLVEVVSRLGEAASGNCSKLNVVEIPDNIEYSIEEYDGLEWVAEKHRVWY